MTKFISDKLIKRILKDYYHRGHSTLEISKKFNLKKGTINYHLGKIKMTQVEYLVKYSSKEELVTLISSNSYKESANILKIPLNRFKRLLVLKGIKKKKEFFICNSINPDFYLSRPLSFYYYLGLIASDGYIKGSSIRLAIKNKGAKELIEKLAILSDFKGTIFTTKNGFTEITFTDSRLINLLPYYGIPLKRKTFELEMPSNLSKQEFYCYLLGIIDGDGTIYKNSMGFSLVSASTKFINQLSSYMRETFSIVPIVTKNSSCFELRVNSKDARDLLFVMYNTCPLYLECKFKKYLEVRKSCRIR